MVEILSDTIRKARKDHECMACVWLRQSDDFSYMTFTERRSIVKARARGFKILKGELYSDARCKQDGEIYTFRSIPEIHKICVKYDYYQE